MTGAAPTPFQSLIAGTIAGMSAITVCHPLDVIRTRLQLDPTISLAKSISMGNLYSGFKTPFIAQGFYKAVIFASNTASINMLFNGQRDRNTVLISGCIAGAVNSLVVAPVEMVRTSQILRAKSNPGEGLFTTIASIMKTKGITSLWAAVGPTILRDGPGMGLYMLAFEQAKPFLAGTDLLREQLLATKMVAGAFAGVVFWTWAIPIDTIKAMIEARIQSTATAAGAAAADTKMHVIVSRSLKSLPIAYIRGIPSAAVTLTVYDVVMAQLAK